MAAFFRFKDAEEASVIEKNPDMKRTEICKEMG